MNTEQTGGYEPRQIKAGDKILKINGRPPVMDCCVIPYVNWVGIRDEFNELKTRVMELTSQLGIADRTVVKLLKSLGAVKSLTDETLSQFEPVTSGTELSVDLSADAVNE